MKTSLGSLQIALIALLMIAGVVSAYLYWRRQRRLDALLVLCAVLPIAILLLRLERPGVTVNDYVIDSTRPLPPMTTLRHGVEQADRIILHGDGLFQSQWQDLPARPLEWQNDPKNDRQDHTERLQLLFPQRLAIGRLFKLTVRRASTPTVAWRVQLLAENQQVLAEQSGTGQSIQLSWLPPVAQRMVLQAKVWDASAHLIDQGPIPLEVIEVKPLEVEGRFAAPSFDTLSLNQLLLQSHAQLDWQTQLGKGIVRKETASTSVVAANLLIQDAAYFEQLSPIARQQVLARVADGASLIILGGHTQQAQFWAQHLGLQLSSQAGATSNSKIAAADHGQAAISNAQGLKLSASDWQPHLSAQSVWQRVDGQDGLVKRDWQAGHILWLGAAGWHQAMISDAQQLKLWWQSVLDASGVRQYQDWTVEFVNDTVVGRAALAGQLQQVCARGLDQRKLMFEPDHTILQLASVPNKIDAQCAAFWPAKRGWLDWQAVTEQAAKQDQKNIAANGAVYVFQESDWPSWQRQIKQDATRAYAQLLSEDKVKRTELFPTWPLILISMFASLVLWRREQASDHE